MTEKRFQWVFIKDNELEFQDNGIVKRFENNGLEEFLNELNEENKQLQNDCSILIQSNQEYRKENEQLKQYIYDNLDEDICDVCSYQYLEKSQMDKYYVAKCKKGYDNCSKGTVIHCKDFKFKELKE